MDCGGIEGTETLIEIQFMGKRKPTMQMKIGGVAGIGACLLLVMAAGAFATNPNSAVGSWILNPTKSHFQNMPAPRLKRLRILTDDEKTLTWRTSGYGPDGRTFHEEYDGPIDGGYHPLTGTETSGSVAYTRTNSELHWTIKDQSGAIVETGSESLSTDGDTLTLKGTRKIPEGDATYTTGYDRLK
jgi:hypothetical protein